MYGLRGCQISAGSEKGQARLSRLSQNKTSAGVNPA
jgi:hypothetical protein